MYIQFSLQLPEIKLIQNVVYVILLQYLFYERFFHLVNNNNPATIFQLWTQSNIKCFWYIFNIFLNFFQFT